MTQSNEETKKRLEIALKENGLTMALHKKGQTAQEALKGDKVAKSRLNHWNTVGGVIVKIKAHYKTIGVNPNKGDFGNYCTTYFPRLSAKNDIPAAQKLATHWKEFKAFNDKQRIPVGNPMVLFRNVKKSLAENKKATEKDYEKYGFKMPADSSGSKTKSKKKSDSDKSDDTPKEIFTKSIDQCSNSELLDVTVIMIEKLLERSKRHPGQFNGQDTLQIERAFTMLGDVDVNIKRKNRTESKAANASK